MSDATGEKVRLRISFGGKFVQGPDGKFAYKNGESHVDSVPTHWKYAELMHRLCEKVNGGVSLKWQQPGDDLAPDDLISVKDDDDVQEMFDEYWRSLRLPGTPVKSFRIRVYLFPAEEEELTAEELQEGTVFFRSSSADRMGRSEVSGSRAMSRSNMTDGHSSHGSNVSSLSTGTASNGAAASVATRFYSAVNPKSEQHEAAEEAVLEMHAQEMLNNVMIAHERYQVFQLPDGRVLSPRGLLLPAPGSHFAPQTGDRTDDRAPYQTATTYQTQDPYYHSGDDVGDIAGPLPVLPSHISAFGNDDDDDPPIPDPSLGLGLPPSLGLGQSLAAVPGIPGVRGSGRQNQSGRAGNGNGAMGGAGAAEFQSAGPRLPSHISVFGDDLDGEESGGEGLGLGLGSAGRGGGGRGSAVLAGGVVSHALESIGEEENDNNKQAPSGMRSIVMAEMMEARVGVDATIVRAGSDQGGLQKVPSGGSMTSLSHHVHRVPKDEVKVLGRIGEGAFGEVSLATSAIFGKVAVKWLKPGKVERHSASFWREADMLASLNHPNVLRFYGVVVESPAEPNVIGIMTEFMRGGSLAQALRNGIQFVPMKLRAELALNAVNGLAYLHEMKIVHFDLKPDNLLLDGVLCANFAAPTMKVADFGLSKHKWKSYVSGVRDLRGTLPYMAPELVSDPDRVSEKADVWSLGMVLWEMLTLEVPFQHLTPQQIIAGLMVGNLQPEVPDWCEPEWRGLMEACWEVNPTGRPAFRDLAGHLEKIIEAAG
ncbi:hypothetical protein WJX72_005201 [[Myrmecia] bisecta]|uniref:Protein kinase domain-containing protein n=1 Tax=[Myrmecia] bisecta TaxID=41462 RepID=A0AAW1R6A6_9CHLO